MNRTITTRLLAAVAALAAVSTAGTALASTGGETRTVAYKCDRGAAFTVSYYFGAPAAYAILDRNGVRTRLNPTDEGFANRQFKLAGEIMEENADKESVFLFQKQRSKVNGRWISTDAVLGKSCEPQG